MQKITIATDAAVSDDRYPITGRRLAILKIDAPILLRFESGGQQLPFDRPGRIAACGPEPISEIYVTLEAADVLAAGEVVIAASNDLDFDFPGGMGGSLAPVPSAFAIAPADGADIPAVTRAIYVGVSGDLKVMLLEDSVAVTFVGLAAGIWHPMRVQRVYATGTTATDIIGGL